MQRTRNGGAATPAIGGRIVDFEFALAAEAADNVDFPAHLGHRHLGAGGGHWGADDPTADALGEGRGSEQGTAGQQHATDERYELAPPHVWMAPAWQEIIWRAAQRSLAVMCPACWCSPGGLLALMGSANRVLITRTGSMSR